MYNRFLPWLILLTLPLLSCNRENNQGPETLQTYTKNIGTEGGSLAADGLTYLEIPPDAIGSNMEFSATPLADANAFHLLDEDVVTGFLGGVDFGPDGTEFDLPVNITLPLNASLIPGSKMALYYFDTHLGAWVESEEMGTVSADGNSVSARVDHFTTWGIFDLQTDIRIMGKFMDYFGTGDDPIGALNNYVNWFNDVIKPLGFRGLVNNCCYAIRGYQVEVVYKVNGIEDVMKRNVGEGMIYKDLSTWFLYNDYLDIPGYDIKVTMNLRLYLGCKPDLYLTSDKGKLRIDEKATLNACLVCGDIPMKGATIGISNSGEGKLNTERVETNAAGKGEFTLSGDESGMAQIHASYEACKCEYPTEEYTAGYNIPIGDSETWTGNFHFSSGGCSSMTCVDKFEVSIDFEISTGYNSDGYFYSTLNILDSSISVSGLDISPNIYDGYIKDILEPTTGMSGKISQEDGQMVFKFGVSGDIGFTYCYSPMDGIAISCQPKNSCWIVYTGLGEEVILPENGQLSHSDTYRLICGNDVEGVHNYTLTMQRVD